MQIKEPKTALLIIDMLNTLDFPEAKQLRPHALKAARQILKLKKRMQTKSKPVIYVNDNFGQWRSSWHQVYEACVTEGCYGAPLAQILRPEESDYFVLKPRHSGFFNTNLEILLEDLKVKRLILTGIAGNICVYFTANDAYMRNYDLWIPEDCIASNTERDNKQAIAQMKSILKVKTTPSSRGLI
ncbi:cysteine hydrolase family protein [Bdellovibrio sp. HCB2-146]|uniref:cysteine hydrolase family protein n=1 Tax=Bdellovibrio sp. HCB2-146 TaxID=3394362 RepID=UPI0039BC3F07